MPGAILTQEARSENARTLAHAAGLSVDEAERTLDRHVLVSAPESDATALALAQDLIELLVRSVTHVSMTPDGFVPDLEVVVGATTPKSSSPCRFAVLDREGVTIDDTQLPAALEVPVSRPYVALAACYVAAAAIHALLPLTMPKSGPVPFRLPFRLSFAVLGLADEQLTTPFDLGTAYLAGAGAIGNGFLWALRHLPVSGELIIADDDVVASGNLNRQLYFNQPDIGQAKALCLAEKARPAFAHLTLRGYPARLQNLPMKTNGAWLRRLIVAVDSRRARRELQNECPGEVFDASTTGIHEVVIHHHRQPTTAACLACIYRADDAEYSLEQHIAEHLDVAVTDVRESRISSRAAARIAKRHPHLAITDIEGAAYDTLFKQLCASGELAASETERVLAPFAFVSALAGTLLALELARRLTSASPLNDNYWSVSAWRPPLASRRRRRLTDASCGFCGSASMRQVSRALWG
ncbi:MAG: ThiF family adenylyltransferase [Gemmatimonadaceae bacterium]